MIRKRRVSIKRQLASTGPRRSHGGYTRVVKMPISNVSPARAHAISLLANTAEDAVNAVVETGALAGAAQAIDKRDLIRALLLHLPRFSKAQLGKRCLVLAEARRLAEALIRARAHESASAYIPPSTPAVLDDLFFDVVSPAIVRSILADYHYLRHPRDVAFTYGLFTTQAGHQAPYALFTVSDFDLAHLTPHLPDDIDSSEVLVLSRVYAAPAAPANSISYGLALLRHKLHERCPHARLLLSYINPNLGFTGASLQGANWLQLYLEQRDHYLYYRNDYITDRECRRRFGSFKPDQLMAKKLPISTSRVPLEPLQIYGIHLYKRDRNAVRSVTKKGQDVRL